MRKGIVGMCCIFFLLLCGCGSKADVILQNEESEATDEGAGEARADENGTDGASEEDVADGSEDGEQTSTGAAGDQASADADATRESPVICAYICGAVAKPGVYTLPAGGRVYQLLEMAGGFLPEADERSVNLAQALEDGAMVFIPTEEESAAGVDASAYTAGASTGNTSTGDSAGGTDTAEAKVNINTADASALTTLNGIGEAKAAAIVAYREEHGSFQSLEEIMEVSGIGEATYAKIKDNITL